MATENNPMPNGERENEEAPLVPASSDEDAQIEVSDSDTLISSDALDKMPPDDRSTLTRTISAFAAQFVAPVVNPIYEKFTSDHISTIIDNAENERIRESDADKSRRRYQFAYVIVGALMIGGAVVFFTLNDNEELMIPIITEVAGFLGGFAAGQRFRG